MLCRANEAPLVSIIEDDGDHFDPIADDIFKLVYVI